MADEEEERVIEQQLELQLHEQRESLSSLNDILNSDPSNPEVLAVHEELVLAIKDAEEGLFHLKRARLLREVDSVTGIYNPASNVEDVKVEPVVPDDGEAEPLEEEGQGFVVGSKCRFRHTDGRWYNGQIVGMDGSDYAKVSFLTPTSEKMLICKFFMQQRCRFGVNCRLSHGINIPVSSLRKFVPTNWEQSLVGSNIWALSESGIWKEAELDTWDDESGKGKVVFKDDGSCANLEAGSIALSGHASLSDEEQTDSSSLGGSELSEDEEDEEPQGLGFTTQLNGIQTETVIFAKWENHTRGIASKMMASMGYREGMGLGVSGQGMLDPIPVKVLPAKQSLELALESKEGKSLKTKDNRGKKRSRGGRRKQDRRKSKLAEAAKAEEELERPDVFSLINSQLAIHSEKLNGGSGKKKKGSKEKKIERRDLVAYDDEVKELRVRVEKLEEMVERNRKEKAVYDAATRKLRETRKALADAEANHASATSSLNAKEKEKRWLKF